MAQFNAIVPTYAITGSGATTDRGVYKTQAVNAIAVVRHRIRCSSNAAIIIASIFRQVATHRCIGSSRPETSRSCWRGNSRTPRRQMAAGMLGREATA